MIYLDNRAGNTQNRNHQKELMAYLPRLGCKCELSPLDFGDAAFEGNGPNGSICIGIERKTLPDMLACIEDARYAAHQRPGLLSTYQYSILMLEGVWKPDSVTGYLMECVATLTWRPYRQSSRMTQYSKLFRYLLSIQLGGQSVVCTRDLEHTAYNIRECFAYFSKPWDQHTALLETQKLNLPSLTGRPSLVRRWASDLDGVGVKSSMEAERIFRTPFELAKADEGDWMRIPGVGAKTARSIIKQIHETP